MFKRLRDEVQATLKLGINGWKRKCDTRRLFANKKGSQLQALEAPLGCHCIPRLTDLQNFYHLYFMTVLIFDS